MTFSPKSMEPLSSIFWKKKHYFNVLWSPILGSWIWVTVEFHGPPIQIQRILFMSHWHEWIEIKCKFIQYYTRILSGLKLFSHSLSQAEGPIILPFCSKIGCECVLCMYFYLHKFLFCNSWSPEMVSLMISLSLWGPGPRSRPDDTLRTDEGLRSNSEHLGWLCSHSAPASVCL